MWFKNNKYKLGITALIAVILAAAFWYGGSSPGMQGWSITAPAIQEQTEPSGQPAAPQDVTLSENAAQSEASVQTSSSGDEQPEQHAGTGSGAPVYGTDGTDIKATENNAVSHITEQNKNANEKDSAKPTQAATERQIPETAEKTEATDAKNNKSAAEFRPGEVTGSLNAEEKLALAAGIASQAPPPTAQAGDKDYSVSGGMSIDSSTGKDKYFTDPVPEGKPLPVEPQDSVISDRALTCTLSVRCDTILENIGWLDPEKVELVPQDGVIFAAKAVTFYEGESVFNVLQREMKKARIHMEFENTPMYNSAYIEGINNLYEFDCGELSGWMYKVNGWFPNYGCSRYQLKDGDVVEWVYTCTLGIDVGGYFAVS